MEPPRGVCCFGGGVTGDGSLTHYGKCRIFLDYPWNKQGDGSTCHVVTENRPLSPQVINNVVGEEDVAEKRISTSASAEYFAKQELLQATNYYPELE